MHGGRRATEGGPASAARVGHLPIGYDHFQHLPIGSDHFPACFVLFHPHLSDRKMGLPGRDIGAAAHPRQEEMPVGRTIKMVSISIPPMTRIHTVAAVIVPTPMTRAPHLEES
jgi:hypothetical protein